MSVTSMMDSGLPVLGIGDATIDDDPLIPPTADPFVPSLSVERDGHVGAGPVLAYPGSDHLFAPGDHPHHALDRRPDPTARLTPDDGLADEGPVDDERVSPRCRDRDRLQPFESLEDPSGPLPRLYPELRGPLNRRCLLASLGCSFEILRRLRPLLD